jgi:predicted nucleic acid-binding Zn ribbon protein
MEPAHRKRKTKSKGRAGIVGISTALESTLKELGIAHTLARYDVLTLWPDIVGEQIARVTKPERVDNGVLFVSVTTAAWRNELSMKRPAILKKISARVGKGAVKDVRFR